MASSTRPERFAHITTDTEVGRLFTLLDRLPLPGAFRTVLPGFEVRQQCAYHFPTAMRSWCGRRSSTRTSRSRPTACSGAATRSSAGQKLAEFNARPKRWTAASQDGTIDPANDDWIIACVRQYLPGLVPEPYAETTCLFTNTPTEDFLIDGVDAITRR